MIAINKKKNIYQGMLILIFVFNFLLSKARLVPNFCDMVLFSLITKL